jgi:hypothetical protein
MFKFIEDTHQYFLGDKELISVTTLMRKHGLSPNYDGIPNEVLRAKAERGSLIHKEIEEYIKYKNIGFTYELTEFVNYIIDTNTHVEKSEFYVYNDVVAGTVDLLLEGGVIADIKTTSQIHKEAVSWQLSIYAYLSGLDITKGQVFHFNKEGELNVIDIPLKPESDVINLLECEKHGRIYEGQLVDLINNNKDLIQLIEVETIIQKIEEEKKAAEEKAKELRAAIMEAMEKAGVLKFENESIALTYIAPTTRSSIDSTRLKKEMPEIAEKYNKISNIKASLRITLKEVKTNE